jgi:uncharacterized membrane protein YphA (DoxX/SURF4 family)
VRARHRPPTVQAPRAQKGTAAGLVLIRISVGVCLFFVGYSKVSWLLDASPWANQLSQWTVGATPISRWYLDRIVPGAPIFARVIPIAEMIGGLALAFGFWTRLAAGLCLVMVLNVQIAAGAMFKYSYLADATGLLLVGALLGLIVGGTRLPLSLRK